MLSICALLMGCSNSTERIIKKPIRPPLEGQTMSDGPGKFGTASSGKGQPCMTVNATTKKCLLPMLKLPADPAFPPPGMHIPMNPEFLPDSNWTTYIGEEKPGTPHYIIIEQQAEHRVVAEWRFDIYTDTQRVMAKFDPDLRLTYKFLNKDGAKVGEFTIASWRKCPPPAVEHEKNYVIPGNFDFVADTDRVELEVQYRLLMKNCDF